MISKDKMAETLEQMATAARQIPDGTEFITASFSGIDNTPELHIRHKDMSQMVANGTIYTTEYWEAHGLTEVRTHINGIRVMALYSADEFEQFREMQKTPDAATSEVDEEEFIERMNDLQELFSQYIVTPDEEDVKEGDAR